jgi:tryptophan-rich sensory protein
MQKYAGAVLIVFFLLTFTVGLIGSLSTMHSVTTWYPSLRKPPWTPPSWLFGPVWTILYILISLSGWLVWKAGPYRSVTGVLSIFTIQLILNGLWSYFFFGLRNMALAFADIVLLWVFIVLFIIMSWDKTRAASLLFIPYLCWVSFAAFLNLSIWTLNS